MKSSTIKVSRDNHCMYGCDTFQSACRSLVAALAADSSPFHSFRFGSAVTSRFQQALCDDDLGDIFLGPALRRLIEQHLCELSHVVNGSWMEWLLAQCETDETDEKTDEGRLVVGCYLLESALRRVACIVLADGDRRRGDSRAVHSVLLSDIVRDLQAKFSSGMCKQKADVVADVWSWFVDPHGLNVRNLVMHGYFSHFAPHCDVEQHEGVRLMHWMFSKLVVLLVNVASVATAASEVFCSDTRPNLLPVVGLEREPRRREALEVFFEVVALKFRAISDGCEGVESFEALLVTGLQRLLVSFARLEFLLRVVASTAVPAETTHADGGIAMHKRSFLPQECVAFADTKSLAALIDADLASQCFGWSVFEWKFWEAALVSPSGPSLRDMLVHCKWDPFTSDVPLHGNAAADILNLATALESFVNRGLGRVLPPSLAHGSSYTSHDNMTVPLYLPLREHDPVCPFPAREVDLYGYVCMHALLSPVVLLKRRLSRWYMEASQQLLLLDFPTDDLFGWSIGAGTGVRRECDFASESRLCQHIPLWQLDVQLTESSERALLELSAQPWSPPRLCSSSTACCTCSCNRPGHNCAEMNACIDAINTYWTACMTTVREAIALVAARRAREAQRASLRSKMQLLVPLLHATMACATRVLLLMSSSQHQNDDKYAAALSVTARIRRLSAALSSSRASAPHIAVWTLSEELGLALTSL